MTRYATSVVHAELRDKLGSLVTRESPHTGDQLLMVKIESDLIDPNDNGSHVETVINPDGSFRFKRADYDYWET